MRKLMCKLFGHDWPEVAGVGHFEGLVLHEMQWVPDKGAICRCCGAIAP